MVKTFIKIGRKVYNTATAKVINVKFRESNKEYFTETLYKKRNGEYFVDAHITNKKNGETINHIFVISKEVAESNIWQNIYYVATPKKKIITSGSFNKCRRFLPKMNKAHKLTIFGNDGSVVSYKKNKKLWLKNNN